MEKNVGIGLLPNITCRRQSRHLEIVSHMGARVTEAQDGSEGLDTERQMMLAGITSLIEALEARDTYTRGHSESVATILTGVAGLMGADNDVLETLRIAGRLHDLGKIGIPDNILLKPREVNH